MTLWLTTIYLVGIVITGLILVRVKMPLTMTEEFLTGLATIIWPLLLLCISITIFSRLVWTELIDRIVLASRKPVSTIAEDADHAR